jgi:hypothetical protein
MIPDSELARTQRGRGTGAAVHEDVDGARRELHLES